MTKTPPRQLILEAVIACIEKYGIDKLTTRNIALEAGTNIASINYYFRSKDELVAEALTTTIDHMMNDVFAAIDDSGKSFEQMLEDVFFYLIDGAIRFPGISRAHLYATVVEQRYDSPGGQALIRVHERLVERAVVEFPRQDAGEIRFQLAQMLSSIIFTMLAPGFFPVPENVRPLDPERCRALASAYVRTFFACISR